MRVAVYARVSLDRQGDRATIDRQLANCRRYVEERGHTVAAEFVDRNVSAYDRKKARPEYERMRKGVQEGLFDAICIWKVDRLSRRVSSAWRIAADLQEAGVALMCVEDHVDTSDGMGQAVFSLVVAQAQAESESISKRVKAAWAEAAAKGKPHVGGIRCFGYTQHFEQEPEEAAVAREVVDLMLSGASLNSTAQMLNERGFLTGADKPWRGLTLGQWLKSPALAGIRTHKGVETQGTWEPIITQDEREGLLVLLGTQRASGLPEPTVKWLLTGVVRCSNCGTRMYVTNTSGFLKYSCQPGAGRGACGKVHVTHDGLDKFVIDEMFKFLSNARLRPFPSESSPDVLQSLVASDEQRLDALNRAHFIDGDISKQEWQPRRDELAARIDTSRAALAAAQRETAGVLRPGSREDLESWWASADISQKRAAVGQTLSSVVVAPATRRGGVFDTERVRLNWRFDLYMRAEDARWESLTDDEQQRELIEAAEEEVASTVAKAAAGWP